MNHQPCGIHDNTGYPYIYFPSPKVISKNVCVATCPEKDTKSLKCLKNDICKDGTLTQNVTEGIIIYQSIPGNSKQFPSYISFIKTITFHTSIAHIVAGKICIPLNKDYFASISKSIDIGSFEQVASDLRNTWVICSSSVLFSLIIAYDIINKSLQPSYFTQSLNPSPPMILISLTETNTSLLVSSSCTWFDSLQEVSFGLSSR